NNLWKLAFNFVNYRLPITKLLLPKQTRGGIPRAITPIYQPSPKRPVRKKYPNRLAHRASKMSDTRVGRNNKNQENDYGRRVAEVAQIIAKKSHATVLPKEGDVPVTDLLLQANPVGDWI